MAAAAAVAAAAAASVVCSVLPGLDTAATPVLRRRTGAAGPALGRRVAGGIAVAGAWASQAPVLAEAPVSAEVNSRGTVLVPLNLSKAARLISRQGDKAFVRATLEANRPLYRGEGLEAATRVVAQVPDLDDKRSRKDSEARWFQVLEKTLKERKQPTLGEGQLWVGDVAEAARYGAPCSMWPLDDEPRCLWLEKARLWWPPERPEDAEDPIAWLDQHKPSTDLAAGIASGHEMLVVAPGGYIAVPASMDAQLFELLRSPPGSSPSPPPAA